MDYVVKTRSWHTILRLWESPCPPVLQSNLYQPEVYARFLECKIRKHVWPNSLSEVELSRYPALTSLYKGNVVDLWILLFIQEMFFEYFMSVPFAALMELVEDWDIDQAVLKCWEMAGALSVAKERRMVPWAIVRSVDLDQGRLSWGNGSWIQIIKSDPG